MFKFQYRIALLQFIVGCAIVLTGIAVHHQYSSKATHQAAKQSLQTFSQEITHQIDFVMREKANKTKILASSPVIEQLLAQSNAEYSAFSTNQRTEVISKLNQRWMATDDEESAFIQAYLNNSVTEYFRKQFDIQPNEYGEIFLTNRYGAMVASTGKLTTLAHGHKYWWTESYNDGKGQVFFDDRGFDTSVKGYVLGIVVPVIKDGQIIGILKSNFRIQATLESIINRSSNASRQSMIVRDSGIVVLQSGHVPLSTKVSSKIKSYLGRTNTDVLTLDDRGIPSFVTLLPIVMSHGNGQYSFGGNPKSIDHQQGNQGEGWSVVTTHTLADALKLSRQANQSFYLINSLLVLLLALIALYLGKRISAPLMQLSAAAERIGNGNFNVKLNVSSNDEFGLVAESFNNMSRKLSTTMATKDEYRTEIELRKKAEEHQLELEEQLRQKVKMEAMGVLAGGIAHNFNNNLAIILGNIELAQRKSTNPDAVNQYLALSKKALFRSRDLIKQIMVYSRQEQHEKQMTYPFLIIEETLKLLQSTIPSTVSIQCHVSPSGHEAIVTADETKIQEALINLCINAVHAMDEKGELSVSLDTLEVQQEEISRQYQCGFGTYVQISVKDTGSGISKENMEKIFDPFFTTKAVGQGTGMGLSTVRGILESHGGFIKVHSIVGEGTTFELHFPLDKKTLIPEAKKESSPVKGSEHVLFVDDDEMLANTGDAMLTTLGYQVTTKTNALEALDMINKDPSLFDLVITDQEMPGLTGKEFAQKLKKIRHNLPIILNTGYSSRITAADSKRYGISAFCMKPLKMAELSQTIRACLDTE